MDMQNRVKVRGYWRVTKGNRHYVRAYSRKAVTREKLPAIGDSGTWVETRTLLRWRDSRGKKHSRYIHTNAHVGNDTAPRWKGSLSGVSPSGGRALCLLWQGL